MENTNEFEVLKKIKQYNTNIYVVMVSGQENIKTGIEVIALVKAPQIIIVTDFGGFRVSARNQLTGVVTQIKAGAVNTEIDIELAGGQPIAATVTNDSVETLGIRKGESVTAIFKAGAVILAVAI